jgi:hypothetical protein
VQVARTHRNFLIVLVGIAIYAAGFAALFLFAPDKTFANPSQVHANEVPRQWWAVAYIVEATLVIVGMWRIRLFRVARLGLAVGLFVGCARCALLMQAGAVSLTGAPYWAVILTVHLGAVLEPPVNPATFTNTYLLPDEPG